MKSSITIGDTSRRESQPVELTIVHDMHAYGVRIVEMHEDIDCCDFTPFKDYPPITGVLGFAGEFVIGLPKEWTAGQHFKIECAELTGWITYRGRGRFRSEGAYSCPKLEQQREALCR